MKIPNYISSDEKRKAFGTKAYRIINTKEDFAETLVETITRHPGLNAPTLAERTGRSLRTTQRYLGDLKKKGRIRFEGVAKKGGYYAN